jgi:hypothetical protein
MNVLLVRPDGIEDEMLCLPVASAMRRLLPDARITFLSREYAAPLLAHHLSLPHLLRPCLGKGASLGEEAVLADSGRAGEVAARVGRVRSMAFLSIPRGRVLSSQTCGALDSSRASIVLSQPASRRVVHA